VIDELNVYSSRNSLKQQQTTTDPNLAIQAADPILLVRSQPERQVATQAMYRAENVKLELFDQSFKKGTYIVKAAKLDKADTARLLQSISKHMKL